jgi:hypothetical protein
MSGLARAKLYEVESNMKDKKAGGRSAVVQFNPETLKVSYANQLAGKDEKKGGNQADGTNGAQYVGTGSTKLSLQLWFDITAPMPPETPAETNVTDVRRLTSQVTELMNPSPAAEKGKYIAPAVCFEWGSFKFSGIIDSLEESIEFFSETGVPLRASMSLSMSQQSVVVASFDASAPKYNRPTPGTKPQTQAKAGSTLQDMAAASGNPNNWQNIAAANGIENPRRLAPGQLIDMSFDAAINASVEVSLGRAA